MSITIGLKISEFNISDEVYVLLDEELCDYFQNLKDFPNIQFLSNLDSYSTTNIDKKVCKSIQEEIPYIILKVLKRNILSPPDYVGIEHRAVDPKFDKKYSWNGFWLFLLKLNEILRVAEIKDLEVLAIGD